MSVARSISSFQYPLNSSCTPYNQADFSPEVLQLVSDEIDLLQTPGSPSGRHPGNTNPFSLASSASSVKSRLRVAKCIVVGDIAVGKTTLINRFVNDVYSDNYKATIGVDFEVQKFEVLSRPFTLQIWDTAGQSRFRDITRIYYKGAHAVIICFDLSNFQSFLNVKFWLSEVLDTSSTNVSGSSPASAPASDPTRPFIFLIGTKKDLLASREVQQRTESEAAELAEQIQAEYWSVSSASGDNVSELFHRVACLTFDRYMGNVAELAKQELENRENQSVFYTNGDVKLGLPESGKKKPKKDKKAETKLKNERSSVDQSADQNGNEPKSGKCSRKALIRSMHLTREILVNFAVNVSEQMQSVLNLGKKKTKKSNKVSSELEADSGAIQENGSAKKTKKKTFRCFNYRCTFTVEA